MPSRGFKCPGEFKLCCVLELPGELLKSLVPTLHHYLRILGQMTNLSRFAHNCLELSWFCTESPASQDTPQTQALYSQPSEAFTTPQAIPPVQPSLRTRFRPQRSYEFYTPECGHCWSHAYFRSWWWPADHRSIQVGKNPGSFGWVGEAPFPLAIISHRTLGAADEEPVVSLKHWFQIPWEPMTQSNPHNLLPPHPHTHFIFQMLFIHRRILQALGSLKTFLVVLLFLRRANMGSPSSLPPSEYIIEEVMDFT